MTATLPSRAICLVLDGFGVGDMAGTADSAGPNTLASIARLAGAPDLPTLGRLGLDRLAATETAGVPAKTTGAWGRSRIAHAGADTYLGHQEMMGTIPDSPQRVLIADVGAQLIVDLNREGIAAKWVELPGRGPVIVADSALIADNIEAARGMNINVTGSLDQVAFERLLEIGTTVRRYVPVTRVIVVGGRGFDYTDILEHVRVHPQGHVGVDTPALGVYDEHYRARHLGFPVPVHRQAPSLAKQAGLQVALVGKAADVIACPAPDLLASDIDTGSVFRRTTEALASFTRGLIVANVQETDLAGHEQDPHRYRKVLEQVDRELATLITDMRAGDLLIVTADHGNDPGVGSSQHTREYVPLLVYGEQIAPRPLGTRQTLADVGATLCAWLGIDPPGDGTPMLEPPVTE
jgi:phosphopentomutase